MIAKGMPVQIRRSGTTVAVERLEIGDLVYDPLADNYIELVDILSRHSSLLPTPIVRLRTDMLGLGRPRRDLLISRYQMVMVSTGSCASRPASLEFEAACRLGEEDRCATTLFALFLERTGCISVDGIILRTFDPSSLGLANRGTERSAATIPRLRVVHDIAAQTQRGIE